MNVRMFRSARLFGGVGGILGIVITAVILFNVLIPQWANFRPVGEVNQLGEGGTVTRTFSASEFQMDTLARQALIFGGAALASLLAVIVAWQVRIESHRRAGVITLAVASVVFAIGLVGWFGVSIVVVYFPLGLALLLAAFLFFFA